MTGTSLKSILKLTSFGTVALLPLSCANEDNKTIRNELPNIVMVYADDLAWNNVGYNGAKYYETPNIDKLAAEGMIFTNAYANAPFCSPSRACLLSGLYTPRHSIYIPGKISRGDKQSRKFIPPENIYNLDTSFVTLPEMLKTKGYVTACIGKYHVGVDDYAQSTKALMWSLLIATVRHQPFFILTRMPIALTVSLTFPMEKKENILQTGLPMRHYLLLTTIKKHLFFFIWHTMHHIRQ